MTNTLPHAATSEDANWTEHPLGAAVARGVIVAEITPINESLRFGALGLVYGITKDPVLAAGAMAGTAFVVEGAAAITAADWLATPGGSKLVGKVHDWLESKGVEGMPETNNLVELAIANFTGSAIMTGLKNVQDPTRTRGENRRYGLTIAGELAGFSAILGYATVEGIATPSPMTISLGTLAVGGAYSAYKWGKNRLVEDQKPIHEAVNHGESPQRLGLSDADKLRVLDDERTKSIEIDGEQTPVLVPIDQLYWYNYPYLKDHFKNDKIFYFAHPDTADETTRKQVQDIVAEQVEADGVILYDTVSSHGKVFGDLEHELRDADVEYRKLPITKDVRQRFLYQYDGKFTLKGNKNAPFVDAPGIFETYQRAVAEGKLALDPENGPALAEIIEGDEAERLWQIYQRPFERLSEAHPINSGYDRDGFMNILKDPEAVKAVYREDGVITTLALFLNNIKHCDWLDPSYYEAKYPDAVRTNNHFIFPGIVTDELKRGASYSLPLIQLIAKTQALRETPAIISFECTDKSFKYIPRIVRFAIRRSGVAKTSGFNAPVSRFDYYAISK